MIGTQGTAIGRPGTTTAAAAWLSGERPPLPHREKTPIFDEVTKELAAVEAVEPEPEWPTAEPDEPTVEFERVTPERFWRWLRSRRWTPARVVVGSSSALVLLVTAMGAWFQ